LIGLMQANEAIKYITGAGTTLIGRLLSYDILNNSQMKLKLQKAYQEDMATIYAMTTYNVALSCDIQEVAFVDLMQFRDEYELISILEDHEHQSIDDQVVRLPMSQFDYQTWQPLSDKPHVFYCMSGKRSAHVISKLSATVDVSVYSLRGGLRATTPRF